MMASPASDFLFFKKRPISSKIIEYRWRSSNFIVVELARFTGFALGFLILPCSVSFMIFVNFLGRIRSDLPG